MREKISKKHFIDCNFWFHFNHHSHEDLLSYYGKATKYILNKKHWDYKSALKYKIVFGHPNLTKIEEAFKDFSSDKMKRDIPGNYCLMWLAGISSINPKTSKRVRKKWLSELRLKIHKRVRELYKDKFHTQGLEYWRGTTLNQFLGGGQIDRKKHKQ